MRLNKRLERALLGGPRSRVRELGTVFRVTGEMLRGFRRLHFVGPCVTVFGSARVAEGSVEYDNARSVAKRLGEEGFSIITGGGPGVMEAANRGARDAGVTSIGCNIRLPHEQKPNDHL
ncbi:MAG: LOG family protein, partial [Actinomycetota bacterium]